MVRPFAVIGFTLFFTIAFLFEFETGVTVVALAAFTAALVISLFIGKARKSGVLPAVFASGAVGCVLLLSTVYFTYLPVLEYDGATNCNITAEITSEPEIRYGNYYYESHVLYLNGEDADFNLRLVFSTPPEAEPYDLIEGKFNLYALGASGEDFIQSYKSKGVWLGGYPINGDCEIINVPDNEKPFAKKIFDIREFIRESLYRVFPDDRGDLAVALITGDKSGMHDELYSDFTDIGISHIICVSGFHLSLWSMLILKILRKTGMKQWLANLLACVGVVFVMLVAGMTYSVIRSGIMMIVFLIGDIVMRRRDSLNSLGFAMAAIAIWNPFAMGSVSLKLSALATLGIILYTQYISPDINRNLDKIKIANIRKLIKNIVSLFMITASATAFTLPISLSLYGGFNFICFLANAVFVPLAQACMVIGLLGALFGAVLTGIFNPFAYAAGLLLRLFISLTEKLAQLDYLTFYINDEKIRILLAGLFVFCVAAAVLSYRKNSVRNLACVLCAAMFTVTTVTLSYFESGETKITVVDCGNGVSVLVSCEGENMLIGCGGNAFLGATDICEAVDNTGGGIDVAVVPCSEEESCAYTYKVFDKYKPQKIYYDSLPQGVDLLLNSSERYSFSELEGGEFITACGTVTDEKYCVFIETNDVSALVCFTPNIDYSALPDAFKSADIIISRSNIPLGVDNSNGKIIVLSADEFRSSYIQKDLALQGVDCLSTGGENVVLRAENGDISVSRE